MGKREVTGVRWRVIRLAVCAGLAAGLAACVPPAVPPAMELYDAYQVPATPPRDRDAVRVKVSLGEQRVYVKEAGRMLMVMPVTVGRAGNPTPEGEFRITRKVERHRSREFGFAVRGDEVRRARADEVEAGWRFIGFPLPYWCEIAPGVGFHTGWIRHQSASVGTIRMHRNVAPVFFSMVDVCTPVSIAYAHPEDETHGFIPLPPDSGPLEDHPPEFYIGDGYFQPTGAAAGG